MYVRLICTNKNALTFLTPLPPQWLLLGTPALIDPLLCQYTVLQEVTRPKTWFKPTFLQLNTRGTELDYKQCDQIWQF